MIFGGNEKTNVMQQWLDNEAMQDSCWTFYLSGRDPWKPRRIMRQDGKGVVEFCRGGWNQVEKKKKKKKTWVKSTDELLGVHSVCSCCWACCDTKAFSTLTEVWSHHRLTLIYEFIAYTLKIWIDSVVFIHVHLNIHNSGHFQAENITVHPLEN